MTDPVARLAERLATVPALVHAVLYGDRPLTLLGFEYGSVAERVRRLVVEHPDIANSLRALLPDPRCERCGADGARPTAVRTAYEWTDDGGFNPNHPMHLCPPCTEEFDEYWTGMWADYYAGLM